MSVTIFKNYYTLEEIKEKYSFYDYRLLMYLCDKYKIPTLKLEGELFVRAKEVYPVLRKKGRMIRIFNKKEFDKNFDTNTIYEELKFKNNEELVQKFIEEELEPEPVYIDLISPVTERIEADHEKVEELVKHMNKLKQEVDEIKKRFNIDTTRKTDKKLSSEEKAQAEKDLVLKYSKEFARGNRRKTIYFEISRRTGINLQALQKEKKELLTEHGYKKGSACFNSQVIKIIIDNPVLRKTFITVVEELMKEKRISA